MQSVMSCRVGKAMGSVSVIINGEQGRALTPAERSAAYGIFGRVSDVVYGELFPNLDHLMTQLPSNYRNQTSRQYSLTLNGWTMVLQVDLEYFAAHRYHQEGKVFASIQDAVQRDSDAQVQLLETVP